MECPACGSSMRDDQRICLACGELVKRRVAADDRLQAVPAGVPAWIAFDATVATPSGAYLGASRLQRIFAALIDGAILSAVSFAIVALIGGEVVSTNDEGLVSEFDWMRIALLTAVGAAYSVVFPLTSWRGTPGKKVLGLEILSMDNEPLTFLQSFGRWLAFQVCFCVVLPLVAFIAVFGIIAVPIAFLFLMGDGRSPWDAMAGTRVVS